MLQKEWPILVVDDEPDVLAVTRLALKDVEVDGVPLKLHTARSAGEARQLLTGSPGPPSGPYFAVALIDVVMDTPTAGLDLCDFVRKELKNKTTQLYIRTGQAGLAPERSVLDRYDVNGYFTKVELTEDKLYSLVKSGVRQNEYLVNAQVFFQILTRAAGKSRSEIAQLLSGFGAFLQSQQVSIGIVTGGEPLCAIGLSTEELLAECKRLDAQPGTSLSDAGDKFVYEEATALFRSAEDEDYLLFRGVSQPSPAIQLLDLSYLKVLAALARAGERLPEPRSVA